MFAFENGTRLREREGGREGERERGGREGEREGGREGERGREGGEGGREGREGRIEGQGENLKTHLLVPSVAQHSSCEAAGSEDSAAAVTTLSNKPTTALTAACNVSSSSW